MNERIFQHSALVESQPDEDEAVCPECDSSNLFTDTTRGETVCQECGAVVDDRVVDHGPEWRDFEDRPDRQRVGAPLTNALHDKGLTTTIDWRNKDSSGRMLSPRRRQRLRRLRSWQERIRVRDSTERNLQYALNEINRMTSALGVSKQVRETSAVIYRRALEKDLIRGRSIEGVASGACYAACRQNGVPWSLNEIAAISRVEKEEIGRAYRYLVQELSLKMVPMDPATYVPRLCSALDLDETVQRRATRILELATNEGLHAGKPPAGYAGAAVYLAAERAGESRYQSEVAEAASVTDVTIRSHATDLEAFIEDTDADIDV